MFNRNSGTVKIWFTAVMLNTYELSDVPKLSNLREVVTELYNEVMGVTEVNETKEA